MKLPLFIAKRYLLSKKSHNLINILSGISIGGVTIGTMALIIVLSVFNGFESLVTKLFNSFNPDMLIEVKEGKTFDMKDFPLTKLISIKGVVNYCEVVEENALLKYKDKQQIVTIKGVDDNFTRVSRLDSMIVEGKYLLQKDSTNFGVFGLGIYNMLEVNLSEFATPVSVYIPKRGKNMSINPEESFNNEFIYPSGAFSIQQDFDTRFVIVPLRFARKLMDYKTEVTAVEVSLTKESNHDEIQKELKTMLGNKYTVKNRYQQQELLYKVMQSEKLAIYLILSFILFIAAFNIVGSLSMLIMEKKKDVSILKSMGAGDQLIKRIFMTEGLLISLSGAIIGLFLGAIVCWIQMTFGVIPLEGGNGAFVVKSYPVEFRLMDFVWVFIIVFVIGYVAAWYPVRQISKRLSNVIV
ncbi:MAG: FtsX-like permease family protein [Bacteroidota bacterium]